MSLDLSREDLQLLRDSLATRRREIHDELVHTDDRALREWLREQLSRLETLETRLDRPQL